MGQKLHRRRRSYFRRRNPVWSIVGWVLAALILIPGGFFAAKAIAASRASVPTSDPTPDATVTTTAPSEETTPTTDTPAVTTLLDFHGFYLPYTALKDTATLKNTLSQAADAQLNSVVVELKNQNGDLYYVSETEAGKTAAASVPEALSLSELTEAFSAIRAAGLLPVARLYAFEDAVAPRTLSGAKVTTTGHADWTWYDGDPKNGGRPWLNPYADAAQSYIVALAEELYTAGAGAIMLDGVYFPTQTSQANFAVGEQATLSKGEVLRQFVTRISALSDATVLLSCQVDAALGHNMAAYSVNPLTLGETVAVPDLRVSVLGNRVSLDSGAVTIAVDTLPDALPRILKQINDRAAAAQSDDPPASTPLMDASTAPAVLAALTSEGEKPSFFVYDENGKYDFAALKAALE